MFKAVEKPSGIQIYISATLEDIDGVALETRRFLESNGMSGYAFDVVLVVREALTNAVRHGCRLDGSKSIKYDICLETGYLVIRVEDEGDGFDWRKCLEREPEVTSESGRGLAIMKKYSTDLKYNEKGNQVTLWKSVDRELEDL